MTAKNSTGVPTTIVVAIVVIFCFTVAAGVAIAGMVEDGAVAGSLIAVLLASMATTIPAITLLVKHDRVAAVAKDTNEKVDEVLNGSMDAKLDAAVDRGFERWAGMTREDQQRHTG